MNENLTAAQIAHNNCWTNLEGALTAEYEALAEEHSDVEDIDEVPELADLAEAANHALLSVKA